MQMRKNTGLMIIVVVTALALIITAIILAYRLRINNAEIVQENNLIKSNMVELDTQLLDAKKLNSLYQERSQILKAIKRYEKEMFLEEQGLPQHGTRTTAGRGPKYQGALARLEDAQTSMNAIDRRISSMERN